MNNLLTNILLCEPEENQGMLLRECLQMKGFHTRLCMNGDEALDVFRNGCYDLCVLNVRMPGRDGMQVSHEIREMDTDVPIILIAEHGDGKRAVEGFEMGCDEFLVKPILMDELLSRIEAIMKRVHGRKNMEMTHFSLGNCTYNAEKQVIVSATRAWHLTTRESELLKLLCMRANHVLSRELALRNIWGLENVYNARSMDVYINKLRKIIRQIDANISIINVHGKGYKLLIPEKKNEINGKKDAIFY